MPIETDLNVSPYYDDFSEDKNYHRVIFRPGVALQARELTQLQSILQNQIERFGDNVYKVGTVIKGCSLTTDYSYYYVKLLDVQVDGQPVNLAGYSNTLVVQEGTGLRSYVVNYATGFESTDPNLSTLYLKYLNTGSSGEKSYANSQVLTIYNRSRRVEEVIINNGGSSYSNSDTITFTSASGSGAVAEIITDSSGVITDVTITSKGTGYTSAPTITINTSTGSSANLTAQHYIAQVTVADSSYTAPVGIGSAVKTSDGIIYQKGAFIQVGQQEAILEKYSSQPNNVAVGFAVAESIVNSNVDSTLLDLATGSPNYSAPGANRLKLEPELAVLTRTAAASNNEFLSLLEYEDGKVVKDRTGTQFNSINKELAKRTFEESGNYVLSQFQLDVVERVSNTTHFNIAIGPGVAYIGGNRVEVLNNSKTAVRKSTDTANTINHNISTSYGNYVLVKELVGTFDIKTGSNVTLRTTAGTDVTDNAGGVPSSPGSSMGTARIKSIEYHSGVVGTPDCQYKIYLYDIKMSTGKSFKDVRSLSVGSTALADVVLVNGNAVLNDVASDTLVYNSGISAIKELTLEEFSFRTSTNSTFTSGGSVSVSFSGGNTLPYSGVLTDTLKAEFIIVPSVTIYDASNRTGTVTVANTTATNVTGTSTTFTSDYEVGDFISINGGSPVRISYIYNDTLLGLASAWGSAVTANSHTIAYPAYVPIDFTKNDKVLNVTSNTAITVDLGHSITSTSAFTMYHEMQNFEPGVRSKTLNNPIYVKLSTASLATSTTGPWCLGIPDVLDITGVYVGSSNTYVDTTTNYSEQFELDNGQKDNFYGLAYLKLKPGATVSLSSSSSLLVKLRAFTHGAGKYISTESYPVDDVTVPLPTTKVRTQDIPVFTSPTSGEVISLRDAIDFRTIVANTAVLSSSIASASIDPASTETPVSGEKYYPSPSKSFESTVESYLKRIDRIVLDQDGKLTVVEGIPAANPSAPSPLKGTMDIGLINIAPYPSLSAKEASAINRSDLSNSISLLQTKGYTMKDIGSIEQRVRQLEYYTLLSAIESNTINTTIPSEANSSVERFKNGFFVDSFDNYNISNISDNEYKALVNKSKLTPQLETTAIDVKFNSANSTNVTKTGDLVTLSYTHKELVNQPIANKERTLVEDFWKFAGKMTVVPSFDNFFDTTTTATSSINVDLATPMTDLVNGINSALSALNVSSSLVSTVRGPTVTTASGGNWATRNQNITNTYIDVKTGVVVNANTVTDTQNVGNFLTSINVNPYIREQQIAFYAAGLRPGATHYVFFDGVDLTTSTRPAQITSFTSVTKDSFKATGVTGAALVANSTGEVAALINVPGGTFTTGERNILVMDVSSLSSETSATSKAVGKFSAFNVSGNSTDVTFSTKTFQQSSSSIFTSRTYDVPRVETYSVSWTDRWDPLAQTFTVQKQDGGDTLMLTKIDVFFKQKDSSLGVTLELREVDDNGFPTSSVLPFSTVHLQSSEVNTSSTAATATTFTFPSPVAVRANRDYAIVLTPDANSPEYRIWSAETGVPDVGNSSLVSNQSWGLGTMFYSVSGRAFTPVQGEDIKFKVYRAEFSPTSGTLAFNNGDYEFLTTAGVSGAFKGGEDVAQMANSYLNTTLTVNSASRVITTSSDLTSSLSVGDYILVTYGTSQSQLTANVKTSGTTLTNSTSTATTFDTDFANGDFIRIGSEIRQVIAVTNATSITLDVAPTSGITDDYHYTITPVFDILRVDSANSTSITVNKVPAQNTSSTVKSSVQKVVRGIVSLVDADADKLYLANSTASSDSFKLRTANSTYFGYLIGDDSQATATISSINNVNSSIFTPLLNTLIVPGTAANFSATLTKFGGGTDSESYSLVDTNKLTFGDLAVVKSLTNEISGSTITKSFTGTIQLSTGYSDSTPVIDINPSSIIFNNYKVNNSNADENTRYGNATSKYISKRLVLADGLDAEDLRLYVNAYKPTGTEIDVYAKVLNSSDGDSFDDKDWSKLDQVTAAGIYSSILDESDVREFEYTFKRTPTASKLNGKVTSYSNTTITGSSTNFSTDLAAGDLVKIVNTSSTTDYDIIPVTTVSNTTQIILSSNVSFTGAGLTIEKVTLPKEAFKYSRNSGIVRYFDEDQAAYDSYKYLAIKIVMRSNASYLVPKLEDVRAIACSV